MVQKKIWLYKLIPVALLLPLIMALIFFHQNNLWKSDYWNTNPFYFNANIFRLILGLYLTLTFILMGHFVSNQFISNQSNIRSKNLVSFTLGFSVFGIVFWILTQTSLIYRELWAGLWLLGLMGTSSVWMQLLKLKVSAAYKNLRTYYSKNSVPIILQDLIAFIAFAIVFCKLLIWKGLFPETQLTDMASHYIPFYEMVAEKHSVWQSSQWWLPFFFQKGSSLQFFILTVGDVQSLQIVGFIFFGGMIACAYDLLSSFVSRSLTLLLLVLFMASPFVLDGGFQKIHLIFGPALILISNLIWQSHVAQNSQLLKLTMLPTFFLSLMLPLTAALTLPLIASAIAVDYLHDNKSRYQLLFKNAGLVFCTSVGVLILNFYMTGLFDQFPPKINLLLANSNTFSSWLDPLSIINNRLIDGGESINNLLTSATEWSFWSRFINFFVSDHFIKVSPYLANFLGISVLIYVFAEFRTLPKTLNLELKKTILTMLMIFLITAFMVYGSSSDRLIFFTYYFRLFIFAIGLYLLAKKIKIKQSFATLIFSISCLASLWYFESSSANLDSKQRGWSYFKGELNYGQIYHMMTPFFKTVSKKVEGDQHILELSFCYSCHSIPGPKYEHFVFPYYLPQMTKVLYGSPAETAEVMKKYKNNYVFFTSNSFISFTAYAEIFSPSKIGQYFKVFYAEPPNYLLTWKDTSDPVTSDLSEEFVQTYTKTWNDSISLDIVKNYTAYSEGLKNLKSYKFFVDQVQEERLRQRVDLK